MISEKTVIPISLVLALSSGVWWASGRDSAIAAIQSRLLSHDEDMRITQHLAVEMAAVKTQMEEMNKRLDRLGVLIREMRQPRK